MEFLGRISKVLPLRTGVSQRTNAEWKALPFVLEYFENETDRYADSVLLETFDEGQINQIKEGMEVRCGFSHRIREYNGKVYNEVRLYRLTFICNEHTEATTNATEMPQNVDWDKMEKGDTDKKDGDKLPF